MIGVASLIGGTSGLVSGSGLTAFKGVLLPNTWASVSSVALGLVAGWGMFSKDAPSFIKDFAMAYSIAGGAGNLLRGVLMASYSGGYSKAYEDMMLHEGFDFVEGGGAFEFPDTLEYMEAILAKQNIFTFQALFLGGISLIPSGRKL